METILTTDPRPLADGHPGRPDRRARLGVRNVIALTGDPPSLGDQQDSTAVYDVISIRLVKIIDQFNPGLDHAGKPFGGRSAYLAVASDPTARRPGPGGRPLPSQGLRRRTSDDHAANLRPAFVAALLRFVRGTPRPLPRPRADRHPAAAEPPPRQLSAERGPQHHPFARRAVRMERAGVDGRKEGVSMAQEPSGIDGAAKSTGRVPDAELWAIRGGVRGAGGGGHAVTFVLSHNYGIIYSRWCREWQRRWPQQGLQRLKSLGTIQRGRVDD